MLRRLDLLSDLVRRSPISVPAVVGLALVTLLTSELVFRGARDQLSNTIDVGRVRIETLQILRRLNEIESSQRGYLLTGSTDYLIPYEEAVGALRSSEQRLDALLSNKEAAAALTNRERMRQSTEAKLSEVAEVMRLFRSGKRERAHDLVQSGIGREQMENVQREADLVVGVLNARISTMLTSIFDNFLLGRAAIAALVASSLLGLAMFLRVSWRYEVDREHQQAMLQREKDGLELEVTRRTEDLTDLARHLETAREDERARLARDLHDELGALLTAAKLDVARIRPGMQRDAPDLLPRLSHLTDQINAGIALKRNIIENLRPSTLDNLGLAPALEVLCSESQERLQVPIQLQLQPVRLSRNAELTVYRLVQESLNNIAKHARAKSVQVSVAQEGHEAVVRVQDDGVGFDPSQTVIASHGLRGMRYRVAAEKGTLTVDSAPGAGTRTTARLPLADEPDGTA